MARNGDENRPWDAEKKHTGGFPSARQVKSRDRDANRNRAEPGKRIPAFRTGERSFDLVVDGVPYFVKAVPFLFNGEMRFRVFINAEEEHLFTWDTETGMLRAIDDDASVLPAGIEEAVSQKLQRKLPDRSHAS